MTGGNKLELRECESKSQIPGGKHLKYSSSASTEAHYSKIQDAAAGNVRPSLPAASPQNARGVSPKLERRVPALATSILAGA